MNLSSENSTAIRELSRDEIDNVSGGIAPLILFGAAVVGKLTATSFAGWASASVGLVGSTYYAAKYMSGQ